MSNEDNRKSITNIEEKKIRPLSGGIILTLVILCFVVLTLMIIAEGMNLNHGSVTLGAVALILGSIFIVI